MVSSLVGALVLASSAAVNLGWNGFDYLSYFAGSLVPLNRLLLSPGQYELTIDDYGVSHSFDVTFYYGDDEYDLTFDLSSEAKYYIISALDGFSLDESGSLFDVVYNSIDINLLYLDIDVYRKLDIDCSSLIFDEDSYFCFALVCHDYVFLDGVNDTGLYYFTGIDTGVLTYDPYVLASDNPVSAISDGLGVVSELGKSLNRGFNALAWNESSQTMTAVMSFGFLLMGIGISFGVVKKCFNWVTGRHGM